jgi:3-hydroxyisobutyrate dehydrogenase
MNVGYLGLGIMGSAMAANLLKAKFALTVWNRTPAKAEPLRAAGARVAASPADAASSCDVICINVTDTGDVAAILFGDGGVASRARAGLIVIDHSTIRPDATRDFAKRLTAIGVTLLDAPVSGGDVGARNGTLSIMVGGDAAAFERCRPVLQAVGKTITHVGDSGAGQVCKACNQIAVLTTLAGVCEAMSYATKNGLDLAKMVEVVGGGAGASWQLANLGPKMIARDFSPGFRIDLALKDLRIVESSGAAVGTELRAIVEARRYLERVRDAGGEGLGTQAMITTLLQPH